MPIFRTIALTLLLVCRISSATLVIASVSITTSDSHYLQYLRWLKVPPEKRNGDWNAGNDVAGKTAAEISAIVVNIKLLETDAIRKEIVEKMMAAHLENFQFTLKEDAEKTIVLRLEAIKMIKFMNDDQFYWFPAEKEKFGTKAPGWNPNPVGSGELKCLFQQSNGKASAAISNLCYATIKNKDPQYPADDNYLKGRYETKGECFGAFTACIWWGSFSALGVAGFDQKHSVMLTMVNNVGDASFPSGHVRLAVDTQTRVPGDWLYMVNYNYEGVISGAQKKKLIGRKVLDKDKNYNSSGENAMYVGGDLYTGLGIREKTEGEMAAELASDYNSHFEKVFTLAEKYRTIDAPGKWYQGTSIQRITFDKISEKVIFRPDGHYRITN